MLWISPEREGQEGLAAIVDEAEGILDGAVDFYSADIREMGSSG